MADAEESGKTRHVLVGTGDLIAVGGVLALAFALMVRTYFLRAADVARLSG